MYYFTGLEKLMRAYKMLMGGKKYNANANHTKYKNYF